MNENPMRPDFREVVYDVLDGERVYQDYRWNSSTTASHGKHSVAEFVLFMEDYLAQARSELSRNAEPKASQMALHTLRKIVAMGVSCFEQHGVPERWADEMEIAMVNLRKARRS